MKCPLLPVTTVGKLGGGGVRTLGSDLAWLLNQLLLPETSASLKQL